MDFRSNEADRIAQSVRAYPYRLVIACLYPVVATRCRGSRSFMMDYAKPAEVVAAMIETSQKKLALGPRDRLIRATYQSKQAGYGVIPDDAVVLAK
jgi:hypothetical protein